MATRLIERNSTIPTRYSKIFITAAPYQTAVEINVLQGERPMAKDNKCIGKFKLKGIRRAMAGVPQIEVTFDIDSNGIIKVSAKDLDTGKQQEIIITANDRMSDAEIEQAMRDAIICKRKLAGSKWIRSRKKNLWIYARRNHSWKYPVRILMFQILNKGK